MMKQLQLLVLLTIWLGLSESAGAQIPLDFGGGVTRLDERHTFDAYDTTITESHTFWTASLLLDIPIVHFSHDASMGIMWGFLLGYGDSVGYINLPVLLTAKYGADAGEKTGMRFGVTFGIGESFGGLSPKGGTKTSFWTTVGMVEGDWAIDPDAWHVLKLRFMKSLIASEMVDDEIHVTSTYPAYALYLTYEILY